MAINKRWLPKPEAELAEEQMEKDVKEIMEEIGEDSEVLHNFLCEAWWCGQKFESKMRDNDWGI